jgi:hypothetical protein
MLQRERHISIKRVYVSIRTEWLDGVLEHRQGSGPFPGGKKIKYTLKPNEQSYIGRSDGLCRQYALDNKPIGQT